MSVATRWHACCIMDGMDTFIDGASVRLWTTPTGALIIGQHGQIVFIDPKYVREFVLTAAQAVQRVEVDDEPL